jgi:hypothetical protein
MPAYLDLSEDYLPSTQSQVEGLGVSSTTWRPSPRGGLRLNAAPSAGALNEWALEVLGEVGEGSAATSGINWLHGPSSCLRAQCYARTGGHSGRGSSRKRRQGLLTQLGPGGGGLCLQSMPEGGAG